MSGISDLTSDLRELSLPLPPCQHTARRGQVAVWKEELTRTQLCASTLIWDL